MASQPRLYVRSTELIGFEELVKGGRVSAQRLLEMVELDPRLLRRPDALMPFQSMAHLLETAAEQLERPSIGLEYSLAAPDHAPALGPLVLFAKMTTTAQAAITLALQYWRYHTNAYTVQQLNDPDAKLAMLRFKLQSSAPPSRQYVELAFANIVRICRIVTGFHDVNPTVVRFEHPRPSDTVLHEAVFRCPLEFNASHSEIAFDPSFLELELTGTLQMIKPIVGLFVRYRISCLPVYDQTMTKTVELAIPSILGAGNCNVEFVATSIGLSSKKLRRLLASEGTSFSDILDRVRSHLAQQYLIESDAPVASIAHLLDYGSAPPFILAFKRWRSETPTDFRRRHREAGPAGARQRSDN
jgi:AraC-like DNA-binding protein